MLFERQRLLLRFLDELKTPVTNTDFQKLLFLYTKSHEHNPTYEFVPYKYGAFSFTSYADKRRLIERGLLSADTTQWELTDSGRTAARERPSKNHNLKRFCAEHASLRGNHLIAMQYREYPYYATRSEILEKILPDAGSRRKVERARPPLRSPGLVTIGYEGRSLEAYLNCLLNNGVSILCDVRRNALSRKYGFSKRTLSNACEGVGIRYEHIPELGIDSSERKQLKKQADYDALFAVYKRESLPLQKAALAKIRGWVSEGERVALTCFEMLPHQCHRHCVSDALARFGDESLKAVHI